MWVKELTFSAPTLPQICPIHNAARRPLASLPASRPWAPPAERGPSLESIHRVSLTVDLCEGNKIIKKIISPQPVAPPPQKKKKIPGPGRVPSVLIG